MTSDDSASHPPTDPTHERACHARASGLTTALLSQPGRRTPQHPRHIGHNPLRARQSMPTLHGLAAWRRPLVDRPLGVVCVCVCGCIHAASAFLQWVACDGSPHPLPPFSCAASHCCPCWPLASWLNLGLGRQAGHDTLPSSLACIVVASLSPYGMHRPLPPV